LQTATDDDDYHLRFQPR